LHKKRTKGTGKKRRSGNGTRGGPGGKRQKGGSNQGGLWRTKFLPDKVKIEKKEKKGGQRSAEYAGQKGRKTCAVLRNDRWGEKKVFTGQEGSKKKSWNR